MLGIVCDTVWKIASEFMGDVTSITIPTATPSAIQQQRQKQQKTTTRNTNVAIFVTV